MSTPSPREFLPFALPDTDDAEIAAIAEVVRSGWLTTGAKVREFERRFAEYIGASHAVAVNSCTAALHLALEAIGVRHGDEVIVPVHTFAATAEVVRYFDARPVLVDVEPRTLNIDPEAVRAVLSPRTRAVIPVHFGGLAADLDAVRAVLPAGLPVIEDAAHALPTRYRGRMIGTISEVTCFSFYANKTMTTGEGGMLVTEDAALADRARIMSMHGISRDAWKRFTAEGSWYYEIIAPGFKYNLTDIAAALGIVQLEKLQRMHARRAVIAARFDRAFADVAEVETPARAPSDGLHAWHLYCIRLDLPRLTIDRARFIERLRALGIGASVHYTPLHLHPYYRETFGTTAEQFPVATREAARLITLPLYSRMTDRDVDDVIAAVLDTIAAHRR